MISKLHRNAYKRDGVKSCIKHCLSTNVKHVHVHKSASQKLDSKYNGNEIVQWSEWFEWNEGTDTNGLNGTKALTSRTAN